MKRKEFRRHMEEREEKRARDETRRHGYEYRPNPSKGREECRRLERGFEMMQEDDGSDDE